jgi:N-acetylmuramoyl-L-alanine amidase
MVVTAAALCLITNVFFEARNEDPESRKAIIEVTMNRVDDYRYPNTVCEVVWEEKQFSWTWDGKHDDPTRFKGHKDKVALKEITEQVVAFLEDPDEILSRKNWATHYYRKGTEVPSWVNVFTFQNQIGGHLYYVNETPYK